MEAVEELVDVISMGEFLGREAKNLGKLPPANLLEKPADLWHFFEVRHFLLFDPGRRPQLEIPGFLWGRGGAETNYPLVWRTLDLLRGSVRGHEPFPDRF